MLLSKSMLLVRLIAVVLCLALLTAGRFGAAELLGNSATHEMASWAVAKRPPSGEESASVVTQLSWAIRLAETNPAHHEAMARLELLLASQARQSAVSRNQYLQSAREQIQRAIALRPVSPYSWTILLAIKRELHEYDAEFRHALHRAVELGPWEPELLLQLADIGLSAWADMPEEERAVIGQVFVRGMQRQQQAMFDVANAHRKPCAQSEAVCL